MGDEDRLRLADWLEATAKRAKWGMEERMKAVTDTTGRAYRKGVAMPMPVRMLVVGKGMLPCPPGGGTVELGGEGEANVELETPIRGRALPDDVVAWLKDKEVRNWLGENGVTTVNIFADWDEVQ